MLDHELWSKERASCTRRIGIPSRMGNARRSASLMSSLAAASYRSGDLDTGQQINSSSAGSCKKTICQTKHDNMTNRTNLATLAAFDSTAVDEKSRREATPRRIMMVAVAGKPTVVSRDEYTRDQTFGPRLTMSAEPVATTPPPASTPEGESPDGLTLPVPIWRQPGFEYLTPLVGGAVFLTSTAIMVSLYFKTKDQAAAVRIQKSLSTSTRYFS